MTNLAKICDFGVGLVNRKILKFFSGVFTGLFLMLVTTSAFSITITTTSVGNRSTVNFKLSAAGTFYVNCGTNGSLTVDINIGGVSGNTITRASANNGDTYGCYYSRSGTKTITISGSATAYNTDTMVPAMSFPNNAYVRAVSGDFSGVFPYLGSGSGQQPSFAGAFNGCANLDTVSGEVFSNYTVSTSNMFRGTFNGCTGLGSIPGDLFAGFTTGAANMFHETFYGCTGLSSIPGNLFMNITTGAANMFDRTFAGCTGLSSIPDNLFSNITTVGNNMFYKTFGGSGITGCASPIMFNGLFANNSPKATGLMDGIFEGTRLEQDCSRCSGTTQYSTSYDSYFNGIPLCAPSGMTALYSCGIGTGSAPSSTSASYGSSFTPASGSGCTAPNGFGSFAGWLVLNNFNYVYDLRPAGTSFTWLYNGSREILAKYTPTNTFTVTTVPFTDPGEEIPFTISAAGTFYIDCGSGGTLVGGTNAYDNYVVIPDAGVQDFHCVYTTSGAKTITIGGLSTKYADGEPAISFSQAPIASVSGNMSAVFPDLTNSHPSFMGTFSECARLTSISANLFTGYTTVYSEMFRQTFSGTGLTAIPSGLFSNITNVDRAIGGFGETFQGCTSLTSVPANLFSGITTGAEEMFAGTFEGCTSLTSVPAGLFSGITTGAGKMFNYTFGKTGLTSLPDGLFAGITNADDSMFGSTFASCANLTGYIPANLFGGLIAHGSPDTTSFMKWIFDDVSTLSTTCPSGTSQFITGYEYYWDDYVCCAAPSTVTYSCGTNGGTAPSSTTATLGSNFTPAANSCNAPNGQVFVGWSVSGTDIILPAGTASEWLFPGNRTLTPKYSKFVVTTRALDFNNGDDKRISFKFLGIGTFTVDCGAGGELFDGNGDPLGTTITRTAQAETTYYCQYDNGYDGVKIITFDGTATGYSVDDPSGRPIIGFGSDVIASLSGNLPSLFPYLGSQLGQYPIFIDSFAGQTNLTTISPTLFNGYTTAAPYMFAHTFADCRGLTSLPSGLFSTITSAGERAFEGTFASCTNLSGYIPPNMFAGLIANNSPYATDMMEIIFRDTGLATSCSNYPGMVQYMTGYESYWDSKVSCELGSFSVTYSCGSFNGTPPTATTAAYGSNFTPAANTCTAPTGHTFVGWAVSGTSDVKPAGTAFSWNYSENKTLTPIFSAFSLTTTSLSANDTISFTMTATGTFYVDCGADGVLTDSNDNPLGTTITRNNTTAATYTCTYSTAGVKTISFGGTATGYSASEVAAISFGSYHLASVSGNMSTVFPVVSGSIPLFKRTFVNCLSLTSVAPTLFSGYTTAAAHMFEQTFASTGLTSIQSGLFSGITTAGNNAFDGTFNACVRLASIPSGLFNGITTGSTQMFKETFRLCTSLTSIPSGLFSNITTGASAMFDSTFAGCTGLAPTQQNPNPIPNNLFSGITAGAQGLFISTFSGCTGLTSLPTGLFSNITIDANVMFYHTFYNCTNLSGYIPSTLFSGLISNGSPYAGNMMTDIFENTGLATNCNSYPGMAQYITGYESYWDSKVSCATGYAVTYSCGDGSGDAPSSTLAAAGGPFTPATSTCTVPSGYSAFAGWAVSGTNPVEVKPAGTAFNWNYTEAKTLTATYTPATYNVTYSCDGAGASGGTPPAATTATYGETFTPAANTCNTSLPTGAIFVGWEVWGTNTDIISGPVAWSYAGPKTLRARFESRKLGLTTTSLPNNDKTFSFKMSAVGTFYVDCGSDGVLSGTGVSGNAIIRADTTEVTYTCTYATGGVKNVNFTGVATSYASSWDTNHTAINFYISYENPNANKIASISDDSRLAQMFPFYGSGATQYPVYEMTFMRAGITSIPSDLFTGYNSAGGRSMFRSTFRDCTSLTSIPSGLFSGITVAADQIFGITFSGCTSLTSIPGGLFNLSGNTAPYYSFSDTFSGCTGLTSIPDNLFTGIQNAGYGAFYQTFMGCTGLTSIPDGLFSGIQSAGSFAFYQTFGACTGLTSLPTHLFSGVRTGAEQAFNRTFYGCTNLSGYIPTNMFSGLIANNSPDYTNFMTDIFANTGLATSCPAGTTLFEPGYEDYWDPKVSCQPNTYNITYACPSGGTAPSASTIVYGTGFVPANNTCTVPTGHTFDGWTVSGTNPAEIKPAGTEFTWNYAGDKTLTATFTPNTYTATYSCGTDGGTAPAAVSNITYGGTFTPAANSCNVPSGKIFVGWAVGGTSDVINGATTWNYNSDKTLTPQYENSVFSLTTTSLPNNDKTFSFTINSVGTFYVYCGDGGVLTSTGNDVQGNIITRYYTTATYTCTYSTGGAKTILFAGLATEHSTILPHTQSSAISFNTSDTNSAKVASISGNLSAIFPYMGSGAGQSPCFKDTFKNCTNLTSIPSTLFANYNNVGNLGGAQFMFKGTFYGCTGLTSIPSGLFSGITTGGTRMFQETFAGCTGLAPTQQNTNPIPANLFSGITTGAEGMFMYTFSGCTGLTSLPSGLFGNVTTGANNMFSSTFSGCTGLTYLPSGLFSNVTTAAAHMFYQTFRGCTGLAPTQQNQNPIPNNLFSGITTGAENLFYGTFYGCTGLTALPTGLFSNITTGAATMFNETFYGCTNLSGYIPTTLFSGLIANNSPDYSNFMTYIFVNTGLATSCPTGMVEYEPGYESYWNPEVSCEPATYNVTYACPSGGTVPSATTIVYGNGFTPAANTCSVPTGYSTFAGWAVSGTNDVKPAGTEFTWNYTEAKTLTATFTPNTINVNWKDYNNTTTSTGSCDYGGSINVPEHSTRNGYTFGGWRVR